jgi:hypothetical protein
MAVKAKSSMAMMHSSARMAMFLRRLTLWFSGHGFEAFVYA